MDAFGRMIQRAMDSHDPPWSMREVARRCKTSPEQVRKYLTQPLSRVPRQEMIYNISEGLKIPITEVSRVANEAAGIPIDPARNQSEYERIQSLPLSKKHRDILYAQFEALMAAEGRRENKRS